MYFSLVYNKMPTVISVPLVLKHIGTSVKLVHQYSGSSYFAVLDVLDVLSYTMMWIKQFAI